MRLRPIVALAPMLLLPLHTQQKPPQPPPPQQHLQQPTTTSTSVAAAPDAANTLSVRVQVVAINAVVHDHKGNIVRGLGKDDFALRVDAKPVPLRYFNSDSDLPLTLGLMVDVSGSQRSFVPEERRASTLFLKDMLTQPHDRAFLVRFDNYVLLLQKITPDTALLQRGLEMLYSPYAPSRHLRGGTLLYDAICSTVKQVIGLEPGRRALIILTDGDDNGSTATIDQAIQQAQLAGIAVYAILYTKDPGALGNPTTTYDALHHPGGAVMQQIAGATGGRLFVVRPSLPIDRIYAEIEADLRTQYRFGFTPPASNPSQFHSLELKALDKHFTVQARTGYYAPK